jgi:CheY-like chemotaxis protein
VSKLTKGYTKLRAAYAPLPERLHVPAELHVIGDGRTTDTARGRWIMFIGPEAEQRTPMVDALRSLGFTLAIANDFHEAKRVLGEQPPDLLVTHVRLGEYNGLQLVLRGKMSRPAMAAIVVVDAPDPVLQRDVAEMDATLVLSTANRDEWSAAALQAISHTGPLSA